MNSRTFTAAWLVTAAVLSSWAVSSAYDQPRPGSTRVERARVQALPDLAIEVDAEVARLTARMAGATPVTVVVRDPFKFAPRERRVAASRAAARMAPAAFVEAPLPADTLPVVAKLPALAGVAELPGGSLTAVVSFSGELHYVRKGDVIGGRYRVDSIALDGADIFDLTLGTISRLKLQR